MLAVVKKQVYDHVMLERRDGQIVHSCLQLPLSDCAVSVGVELRDDALHVKILLNQSLIEIDDARVFSRPPSVFPLIHLFQRVQGNRDHIR